jgi:hypothetical protein
VSAEDEYPIYEADPLFDQSVEPERIGEAAQVFSRTGFSARRSRQPIWRMCAMRWSPPASRATWSSPRCRRSRS